MKEVGYLEEGHVEESWVNDTTLDYEPLAPPTAGEGDQLGRYRLGEVLGVGGMGHVHRAHDPKLRRDVAIKLVHHSSVRARQRMRREAQAMAQLSHPNVLPVYDVAEHDGQLFIAMELVEGTTLRKWLREKSRSWREVLHAFVEAGRGLEAAHRVGLVHRDFNLRNVLVGHDGRVRVMDFGLARPSAGESMFDLTSGPITGDAPVPIGEVTEPGVVMGTPAYMAPEQYVGQSVGFAADQYAFCTALWEGLCGHRPHDSPGATHAYLYRLKLQGPPPAAEALEGVPLEIHRALERGLAAKPEDRFPSMEALLAAIVPAPSKRPRRAVESLAALGVGVVLVASGMMTHEPPPPCQDTNDALAQTWGPARKAEVEQAMRGTEVPRAEQTWQRLESRLDAYAERWLEEHHSVCLVATSEQADPAAIQTRRLCLDDRQRAFDALVQTLSDTETTTVHRAIDASHRLPDPSRCAESSGFEQEAPDDPRRAARVAAARRELARIEALVHAGRYDKAAARAGALRPEVDALEFPPLSVDVAALHGRALAHDSSPQAIELLEQAYFDARAHKLDRRAGKIAIVLVRQYGIHLEQPDEAAQWIDHARGLVEQIDEPDLLASFHMGVGEALHSAGKPQQALEHKERGLELVAELYADDHPLRVSADMGVGSIHAHLRNYEQAFEHLDHALTVVEQTRGPQHPHVAQLLHSIGDMQREQGQLKEARQSLERALAVNEEVFGPSHNKVAASLHNLGLLAMDAGDLPRADELMARSLKIREELFGPQHPMVARILLNLGIVADKMEQDDRALALLGRARDIIDTAYGPEHQIMAGVLNQMGNIQANGGNFRDAVESFSGAVAACEASFGPTHPNSVGVRESLDKAREALRTGAAPQG